jgi:peptidyl-prolyl cis-trans isomerase B (cyclophilin B)
MDGTWGDAPGAGTSAAAAAILAQQEEEEARGYDRRQGRFADAGRREVRLQVMHFDGRRLPNAQQRIVVEVGLVRLATSEGDFVVEVYPDKAPKTVENFLQYVRDKHYDGTIFHRVIPNFMVQGGCPNSRAGASGTPGTSGPGYKIDCEINKNKHLSGTLSMAHAGKNTGGSQFFICHSPQGHLDGVHTVFGKTEDMDVVNAIRGNDRIVKVTIED